MTVIQEPQGYVLDEERERARQHLVAKRDFAWHLVTFIVVNGLVVATWVAVGSGYFWPGGMFGLWGIGLLVHGWEVWRPITDRDIDKELDRRQSRRQ
jgi:hypothetical protein